MGPKILTYGSAEVQKYQERNFSTGGFREIAVQKSLHSYVVEKSKKCIFSEKCKKRLFSVVLEENVASVTPSNFSSYIECISVLVQFQKFLLNKNAVGNSGSTLSYVAKIERMRPKSKIYAKSF